MNVNIGSEFNKKHSKTTNSVELNTARLLIEGTSQEERSILKEAGLDINLSKKDSLLGLQLERTKLENAYKTKFYTPEEVKAFCLKYRLRFLPSKCFKGNIDDETGADLLKFFKNGNIDSVLSEANNNLYVMAPYKAFNFNKVEDFKCKIKPALFYRVRSAETKDKEMYALISDKGSKFSLLRQLLGIWMEDAITFTTINFALCYAFTTIVMSSIFSDIFTWGMSTITLLLGAALWVLTKIIFQSDNSSIRMRNRLLTSKNWTSPFKYDDDNSN